MKQKPVALPVDGTLDLHMFNPRDLTPLLEDYLSACRKSGILQVRIIHGKGRGVLRARVHSLLRRIDSVDSFGSAGESGGGWGATIAILKPPKEK